MFATDQTTFGFPTEAGAAMPYLPRPMRSAADVTRDQMTDYVRTLAGEKPADFAKLVKLWLHPT
jgi:flagellar biosynthesis/type III secretory pathway M-ring protein FliF/YscJ